MSKTARDVIHEWGVGDDRSVDDRTETDSLIASLDAAGFVIVPKLPNKNITAALVLAYGSGDANRWMPMAEVFKLGLAGNAETEWMAGAWRAAITVANEPVTEGERDAVLVYERALEKHDPRSGDR